MKKSALGLTLLLIPAFAMATPYQILMDDVESANWAPMHDGVGDLYDTLSVKQVEVAYTVKTVFGVTGIVQEDDPQFWEAAEYGDFHKAIFAPVGGSDVLEIEISGLVEVEMPSFGLSSIAMGITSGFGEDVPYLSRRSGHGAERALV